MRTRRFEVSRRVRTRLVAFAGCALLVAGGCATVPEESLPQPVPGEQPAPDSGPVYQPKKNAAPRDVVRGFVEAGAHAANNHHAARQYLSKRAGREWRSDAGPVIIEDTFTTVPAVEQDQPKNPNERIIMLRGNNVGQLGPDRSFTPKLGHYEMPLKLRRQPDGQWRIANPPDGTIITSTDFHASYFMVRLYFFDPGANVLVPDLRYVVGHPRADVPRQVIDLLLAGPSNGMTGAVKSMIDEDVTTATNVTEAPDGALVVPLTGIGDADDETKKRVAAQVVLALQTVTPSRIRLLSDGESLIPGHRDLRPGDLPSYNVTAAPATDLPGLVTDDGQVRSLGDGSPVSGPAGSGAYGVESAAQSIDGNELAVVENAGNARRLRVGPLQGSMQTVELKARTLTRPTWRPVLGGAEASTEVWTVADGKRVVRAVQVASGKWEPALVNSSELDSFGPITELRLSRDGTRVAAVAGGKLVVAGVARDSQGSVTLRAPRQLQPDELTNVVSVDWLNQDTLVAATELSSMPVVKLPVDGLKLDPFDGSNLVPPMRQVTAAPGRPIVAVDANGMSKASDVGEVWRQHEANRGPDAWPFYPG